MNPRLSHSSQHRPRGFESLEARYALDGTTATTQTQQPLPVTLGTPAITTPPASAATTGQALPLLAMRVYAAPVGPQPATIAAAGAPTGITLAPLTLAAFQRNGTAVALPVGPTRPANLPVPLYADGFLPTNQIPANLPTERQTMPVITDPPGPPALVPIRPFH